MSQRHWVHDLVAKTLLFVSKAITSYGLSAKQTPTLLLFSFPVLHNYYFYPDIWRNVNGNNMSYECFGQLVFLIYSTTILTTQNAAFVSPVRRRYVNKSMETRSVKILILLWGIVAHKVNRILPYFSPHVHPWAHVHSAAHSVSSCPHQL